MIIIGWIPWYLHFSFCLWILWGLCRYWSRQQLQQWREWHTEPWVLCTHKLTWRCRAGSPRKYQKFIELLKILNSSDLIAVWSISEDWFDLCVDKQGGGEYDTSQETKNWDGESLYEKLYLRTAVLFSLLILWKQRVLTDFVLIWERWG